MSLKMTTKIPNEFQKYWHPIPKDWHENIIGVYHVSSVGCSHQHLEPDEHSGPCLRQTYWEYIDPLPDSDETIGNFEEGNEHHEKLQKIVKAWKPNSIIEYPLTVVLVRGKELIILVGSIDILYKHLFNLTKDKNFIVKQNSIWDIKTAGMFTMPKGKYDKNPTHFDQTGIYGYMIITFELNPKTNMIKRKKIIYVSKHNKDTKVQREKFNIDEAKEKYEDCVERCWYLHDCLVNEEIPIVEPMHWCKYCKYKKRCSDTDGSAYNNKT